MRKFYSITLLSFLLFVSCNQSTKNQHLQQNSVKEVLVAFTDSISTNHKWRQAVNEKDFELLSSLYTENALVLSASGVELSNRNNIMEFVQRSDVVIKNVSTIKRIQATDNYDYEIGKFENKDGEVTKHIIIWKITNNDDVRELEFLSEAEETTFNVKEIDKQRTQWLVLCNANDAKSLIDTMYSENTMYYNNGRLLQGRNDLVAEYQYMNNSQYQLTLNPILVEPVSDTIVYEFGQCEGSYNGKYLLVWQKNTDGIWQVLFDSNI